MKHLSIGFEFESTEISYVKLSLTKKGNFFKPPHTKGGRNNMINDKNIKIDMYGDKMPFGKKKRIIQPLSNTEDIKIDLIDDYGKDYMTCMIQKEDIYDDFETIFNDAEFVITYPNEPDDDISIDSLDNYIYSHFEESIVHIRNILLTCTQYKINRISQQNYFPYSYFYELPPKGKDNNRFGFLSNEQLLDLDQITFTPQFTLGCQIIDVIPIIENYNKILDNYPLAISLYIINEYDFFTEISDKQQHDFYDGLLFLFAYQLERTFVDRKINSYILLRDSLQHLKKFLDTKEKKDKMIKAIEEYYTILTNEYQYQLIQEKKQDKTQHKTQQEIKQQIKKKQQEKIKELLTLVKDIFTRNLGQQNMRQRQFISDVGLIKSDLNKKKVYIEFRSFFSIIPLYYNFDPYDSFRFENIIQQQEQQEQQQQSQEQQPYYKSFLKKVIRNLKKIIFVKRKSRQQIQKTKQQAQSQSQSQSQSQAQLMQLQKQQGQLMQLQNQSQSQLQQGQIRQGQLMQLQNQSQSQLQQGQLRQGQSQSQFQKQQELIELQSQSQFQKQHDRVFKKRKI